MMEKKEIKKPDRQVLKKEAPVKYEPKKEEIQKPTETTRYNKGILTNDKSYRQQRVTTPTYLMLDPKTMYVHEDQNLAMMNYVRMPAGYTKKTA